MWVNIFMIFFAKTYLPEDFMNSACYHCSNQYCRCVVSVIFVSNSAPNLCSCVCGYHVYKEVWLALVGHILQCYKCSVFIFCEAALVR